MCMFSIYSPALVAVEAITTDAVSARRLTRRLEEIVATERTIQRARATRHDELPIVLGFTNLQNHVSESSTCKSGAHGCFIPDVTMQLRMNFDYY